MSTWHDLVTASLIGTERAVVPAVAIPGLSPTDDGTGDPAAVLLDRAALLTAARRAGRRPDHAEPLPVSEPDPRPAVSPAAADRLERMLGGAHSGLLPEWLTAATARRLRVPAHLLPSLLDWARRGGPGNRRLVAETGGPRARWLAVLNPEWQLVVAQAPTGDEAWRLGTAGQRRAYLTALRVRDPGAARELIAGSWTAAGPEERAGFVGVMADGLSLADEPLLEAALDDHAEEVRARAAGLLARLPGSALGRRMAERAVRHVRMERTPRGRRLAIHHLDESPAALQRDGITGPHWLPEVVARTPLRAWTAEFGLTPERIVAVAAAGRWISDAVPTLMAAWSRAAIAQDDQEWMTALVKQAFTGRLPNTATGVAALRRLALRADPALGGPDGLPEPPPDAPSATGAALSVLRFRYEMLKELNDGHGDG